MRRIPILLSLVLILAFALSSCADAGDDNQVPGVTDGFDLTAMPGTGEPGGFPEVTEPVGTPVVTDVLPEVTEPVVTDTTEPLETETAEPVETDVLPPTGMIDPNRLSVLMDFDVVSQDGENLGEVDDFVLNLTNTQIDYLIVDSATFLDIGGRKIAIPWKSVEVVVGEDTEDDDVAGEAADNDDAGEDEDVEGEDAEVAENENVFVIKFSKEEFENAPDFDYEAFPTIGEEVEDWDLYINDYWANPAAGTDTDDTDADVATATPAGYDAAATETPGAGAADTGDTPGQAKGRVKGFVLASELLGMDIVGDDGETIGQIEDAIVHNLNSGKVKYLVVQIDTADGSETRLLAVPVLVLRWDADGQLFGITVDRGSLDAAPFFENDEWPDTDISGWDDQILAYWRDFVDGLDGE